MFSFFSEFKELNSNSFHTLLEITPNSVIDAKKPAKRIVYVLDLSESSSDLAKESIIRSMLFLREIDEVSVVTFSAESSVDIDWTQCTPDKKHIIIDKIKGMRTGGWSNVSGGIFRGIEQAKLSNENVSMIFLSDGNATSGMMDKQALIDLVSKENIPIHAFGIGNHDTDFMRNLSDACNGTYNYIQTAEELPVAYGNALGAVFSTVYQNLTVNFSSSTLLCTDMEGKVITFKHIGDAYADEKKSILLKCQIIQDAELHTLEYEITGYDIIQKKPIKHKMRQFFRHGDDNTVDDDVKRQIDVETTILRLKQARRAGTKERMMNILRDVDTDITSLRQDIDLIIGSVDSEYKTRCLLNKIDQEYTNQRDNRSDDLLSDYRTPFRLWTSNEICKILD